MDRFGKDVADKAISTGAEPTSRYIYPMFEVSNNHVTYYSVQRQESVCITDMKIKAVIY